MPGFVLLSDDDVACALPVCYSARPIVIVSVLVLAIHIHISPRSQHLYKMQVYQLARLLRVPDQLITVRPSPDTVHGLDDEEMIGMDYGTADLILDRIVRKREVCRLR